MLIDSHCHIDASEFDADREEVIQRSQASGVSAIVVPAVHVASFTGTQAVARAHSQWAWPAYGLHPIYVAEHQDADLHTLRLWIEREKPVAVGEIGLDGFVPGLDFARQEWLFSQQLQMARDFDLPVILHVRHAVDLVLKHLRRARVRGGIAHAFNGSEQQADAFIKLGFKLGFGGALTFERALNLRRLAASLPLESLVLETDAPDIAPAWAYKQRNSPEYLPAIAAEVARLRGISPQAVAEATAHNTLTVLAIPPA